MIPPCFPVVHELNGGDTRSIKAGAGPTWVKEDGCEGLCPLSFSAWTFSCSPQQSFFLLPTLRQVVESAPVNSLCVVARRSCWWNPPQSFWKQNWCGLSHHDSEGTAAFLYIDAVFLKAWIYWLDGSKLNQNFAFCLAITESVFCFCTSLD